MPPVIAGWSLALVVSAPAGVQAKHDWLWWKPPTHTARSQRLGLTVSQVLAMGEDKWCDFAFDREDEVDVPHSFGVDWQEVVYGGRLAKRTNEALKHKPRPFRSSIQALRAAGFRFGMACIGLEEVLAGGGTYSIHSPKGMYVDLVALLWALLNKPKQVKLQADLDRKILEHLEKYQKLKVPQQAGPAGLGRKVKLNWVHKYAGEALSNRKLIWPNSTSRANSSSGSF